MTLGAAYGYSYIFIPGCLLRTIPQLVSPQCRFVERLDVQCSLTALCAARCHVPPWRARSRRQVGCGVCGNACCLSQGQPSLATRVVHSVDHVLRISTYFHVLSQQHQADQGLDTGESRPRRERYLLLLSLRALGTEKSKSGDRGGRRTDRNGHPVGGSQPSTPRQ